MTGKMIVVAGYQIPIFDVYHVTSGTPWNRPNFTLPTEYTMYSQSNCVVATGINNLQTPPVIQTECSLPTLHVLDVHSNGALRLELHKTQTGYVDGAAAYEWYGMFFNNGQPSGIDSTCQIITGWTGGTSYNDAVDCRLVALKYDYPNAANARDRVPGYVIYCIKHQRRFNRDGSIYRDEYTRYAAIWIECPRWNNRFTLDTYFDEQDIPSPDEPPFDPSDDTPYNPDIDDTSDTITIPGNPLIGVSNAGWVHVYNPSAGGLTNFGAWLFPNPELPSGADPTEIVNYLLLLCQTLANSRLIDYVLDCHIIPVSPQVTAAADIKVGGRTAVGISAPVVTNDYIDATCGSLNIQEYFGGFQDYLCTKSKLYLPFVGFVDVLPEYWQAGTISVDYKFNVIDGSFMCYVRSASSKSTLNGSIIAQYSGNACVHVPITGINYANMVSGIVGAAMAVEGAKSPTAILGQAYSAANSIVSGGDMVQSNGYSSAASMMGVRYPYLLIERPVPSYAGIYAHDKGFPANISTLLSNVSGYTVIDDIDLSGIPLMEVELNELRTLLKEGVYF